MKTVAKNHLRMSAPIELRFSAIPTRWAVREEKTRGEQCLVPSVSQHVERRQAPVIDPDGIRKRFFKLKMDEDSVLEFLNEVGVWTVIKGEHTIDREGRLLSGNAAVGISEMWVLGGFGHRWIDGRASIETVESMRAEQQYWRGLVGDPVKLRRAFAAAPHGGDTPHSKSMFALEAHFGNTLPVHLERSDNRIHAVIQPITGRELLTALAWVDLLTGGKCKVCQNCGIEYTRGGSKFCDERCERAKRQRKYRAVVKAR